MTEKHVREIKLGLWGPSFESIPNNLDSSGRREFKRNQKYKGMPLENGYIEKIENMPQDKSTIASDVYNSGKSQSLHAAILGAVRFTNINLIQLHNRMEWSKRGKDTNKLVLQTEAMALFKGNFIRILKQIYNSEIINRIKKSIRFVMILDEVDPIVSKIRLQWWEYKDFVPDWEDEVRRRLATAFYEVTDSEYEQEGICALRDNPLNSKIITEEEALERVFVRKKQAEITSPDQINFDSIKNIKF